MALITCQGCQEIIGDSQSACPHCGTPTPTKKSEDPPPGNEPDPVVKKPKAPPPKLVSCEDCGREVSRRAASCPQCGAPRVVSSMIRWDYISAKVVGISGTVKLKEAGNLGAEGWELVLRSQDVPAYGIFKRPYKLCSECKTKVAVGVSHCGNCGSPVG